MGSIGRNSVSRMSTMYNGGGQGRMSMGFGSSGRKTGRLGSLVSGGYPKTMQFDLDNLDGIDSTLSQEYQFEMLQETQKTKSDLIDLIIERIDDLVKTHNLVIFC